MRRSSITRFTIVLGVLARVGAASPRGAGLQRMQHPAAAPPVNFKVNAQIYDPYHTNLAQSQWLPGIGCPTNATVNYGSGSQSYTDAGCPTGDPMDKQNPGL